jgi:alpha-glucosidase
MPHIASLAAAAAAAHEPLIRPLFWEFPHVASAWDENDELMLGGSLLAAPVVTPGARARSLTLPVDCYDFYSCELHRAGSVTVPAPLHRIPLFCPAGTMLPMTQPEASPADSPASPAAPLPHDEPSRVLRLFAFPAADCGAGERTCTYELVEDDGLSARGASTRLRFRLACSAVALHLTCDVQHVPDAAGNRFTLPYVTLRVALPAQEERPLSMQLSGGGGLVLEQGPFVLHSL